MATATDQKRTGVFTEEQEELRESARRFLQENSSPEVVRRLMESPDGFDDATWKQMAELGWLGMAIPEEYGGLGYGFVEVCVLLEEMGRRLLPSPYLSSVVIAANAILAGGSEEQKNQLLPRIAEGSLRATLAIGEPPARWNVDDLATRASSSPDGVVLDGTKTNVLDAATAELFVVAAQGDNGIGLYLVEPDRDGVAVERLDALDEIRKFGSIELSGATATPLGDPAGAAAALATTLDLAAIGIAAEAVGGARECLETTISFAGERVQFERPIGSFQALQHRIADVFMDVEMARSAAYYSAWAAAEGSDETPKVAPLAKAYCSEAFFHAASEMIQIHAGIGFTWEHDAHLYFKRAKTLELLFGDVAYQRELLAQRVGL